MYYKKSELISPHWPLLQNLPCTVHVNTWGPPTASLPWLTESRQRIQMGPKQSLLPNSTETPRLQPVGEKPCRSVHRGASSQGPGHRVMGRRDLSEDNRPWRKAPGECECTGVRQGTAESDKISESKNGYFRQDRLRIHWEYDLTWERAIPDTFSFTFLLFWAYSSANASLQRSVKKVENMVFNA